MIMRMRMKGWKKKIFKEWRGSRILGFFMWDKEGDRRREKDRKRLRATPCSGHGIKVPGSVRIGCGGVMMWDLGCEN